MDTPLSNHYGELRRGILIQGEDNGASILCNGIKNEIY